MSKQKTKRKGKVTMHYYVDRKVKEAFRKKCKENGQVMTRVASKLLEVYVDGKIDNLFGM